MPPREPWGSAPWSDDHAPTRLRRIAISLAYGQRSKNKTVSGVGFLLVESDDPRELTAFLQPYMDLMSFDVRAVYGFDYAERIEELRKIAQEAT